MRLSRCLHIWLISFCILGIILPSCSKKEEFLSGKVVYRGKPVERARIEVYLERGDFGGGPPFVAGNTDEKGEFRLKTGDGLFYLVARKMLIDGSRRVVLKGRPESEPVRPGAGRLTIVLKEVGNGGFEPDGVTFVKGVVKGGVDGVFVYAYDGKMEIAAGPGYLAKVPVEKDGSFSLPLREGTYRIVAMKKQTGGDFGPPEEKGRGEYPGNPVRLRRGTVLDVGEIELEKLDVEALSRRRRTGGVETGKFRLTGKVVDERGEPVPRIYVMAYRDQSMRGRPISVAETSQENGSFEIYLPGPGKYYLGAREILGGPASPGEMTGAYEGTPDHSVVVEDGEEQRDIVIVVREKW